MLPLSLLILSFERQQSVSFLVINSSSIFFESKPFKNIKCSYILYNLKKKYEC